MSNEFWDKAWVKETEGLDFATARRAGRVTIANPNKEDAAWWNEKVPYGQTNISNGVRLILTGKYGAPIKVPEPLN